MLTRACLLITTALPIQSSVVAQDASRETLRTGLEIAEQYRLADLGERRFTHEEFWDAVAPSLESDALRVTEIGRSIQGRAIRAVTFGRGGTTVLLWSQIHGDESTATMALADILHFLTAENGHPLRDRLRDNLTIAFVPMLNPDGAELFQRQNAIGFDINRDARRRASPEARVLWAVRDSISADFGFNLHDQNARTRAGPRGPQAAIALLAPAFNEEREYNEVRSRARLVAAHIASILAHEIPERVAVYDDTFNPRAFGDLLQQAGTSTVLIESGALPNDPQKQRLRSVTLAAIIGALDAIATGSYRNARAQVYEDLPRNAGGARDLLIVGGSIVLPNVDPIRADIAVNYDDPVARTSGRIVEVGDLAQSEAVDTLQMRELYLFPARSTLTDQDGSVWLRIGAPATFYVRQSPEADAPVLRTVP